MKRLLSVLITALCVQASLAQIDTSKVIQVTFDEDLAHDPLVLVYHSMGDVNVQGHENNDVFVYAQELLPSAEFLFNRNNQEAFYAFVNERTGSIRKMNRSKNFLITQEDHVVRISTDLFSLNTNVFVLVPEPTSVAVNVAHQGNISIEGIAGNVEANTDFGSINMTDVEGSILANTKTGQVVADFSNTGLQRPIYLSSFVGNIEVIVPQDTKHNLALHTELGKLYTNFNQNNELAAAQVAAQRPRERNRITFALNGGTLGAGTDFVVKTIKGDIYLRHNE